MDIQEFVDRLIENDIWLRHHTLRHRFSKIQQDRKLLANFTPIEEDWSRPDDFQPIPAVYFQLVQGMVPRFPKDSHIVELFLSPNVLLGKEFILHPRGWFFGSSKTVPQYSTLENLSNITLEDCQIQYHPEYDEMNEVMIMGDVTIDLRGTSLE